MRLEYRLARHSFRFVAVMAGKGGDVLFSWVVVGSTKLREASEDKQKRKGKFENEGK